MTEELTSQARDTWEQSATGWERNADFVARMGEPAERWIVEHLDPKEGETFLELGAGPGDTGFAIAKFIGAAGRLISTDIAPRMIEAARKRAQGAGVDNAEFRVMDAQSIELPDASVDGAVHRFGPMLIPDPAASAREVRRVLRDGGRFATAVWSGPQDNPWVLLAGMSLMQRGHQPSGDLFGPGGMFSVCDPKALGDLLRGAGFEDVTVEEVDHPFEFANFEELWMIPSEIAGPVAVLIAGLPEEERSAVKEGFREAAEQFRTGDEYRFPARSVCALAR